jgi:threonine dehydrogenase-like Zn-dependent dehydrogenase
VVTTARRDSVRRISEELGADACYGADDPDLPRLLDDVAADFVVDAAGGSAGAGLAGNATASLALRIVRPYGTVLELSDLTEPIQLDPELRDKSIHFCFGQSSYYYGMYEHALGLLDDGRIRCDPIVTHEFRGLDRLTEAVEAKLERAARDAIQVQVVLDDPGSPAS